MKANARVRFFVWLVLPVAILLSGCREQGNVVELKIGHALDTSSVVHQAMDYMGKQLETYSGGTMRVDIYPSSQLGSERELIELLQIGSLAMTKVSSSPMEGFVPVMKVFSVPFIFRDNEHVWDVLNSDIGKSLLDAPLKVHLKGLGYYDAGSRSFYSTKKPFLSPDDLQGMKIRVQKSQTSVQMIAALGGAATPISWGELYTALQQGVVDGAENNPPSFYLSRHYEVCKYYVLDEHTAVPDLLLMSQHIWDSLSSQQQQWLQQAVDDSIVFQRQLWQVETAKALEELKANGVEIIKPDKQPFIDAVQKMKQQYVGTEVGDIINAIENVGR